jgi:hypothetical protein
MDPRILCSAAVIASVLWGCSDNPSQPPAEDIDLTLPYGQSAIVPGTSIQVTFERLLEESRCPEDVLCVQAGNGQVLIGAQDGRQDARLVLNTTQTPRAERFAGYTFELRALDPYPRSDRRTKPEDYRATLRITAK